jgi:hypothetical protein
MGDLAAQQAPSRHWIALPATGVLVVACLLSFLWDFFIIAIMMNKKVAETTKSGVVVGSIVATAPAILCLFLSHVPARLTRITGFPHGILLAVKIFIWIVLVISALIFAIGFISASKPEFH